MAPFRPVASVRITEICGALCPFRHSTCLTHGKAQREEVEHSGQRGFWIDPRLEQDQAAALEQPGEHRLSDEQRQAGAGAPLGAMAEVVERPVLAAITLGPRLRAEA